MNLNGTDGGEYTGKQQCGKIHAYVHTKDTFSSNFNHFIKC